MYVNNGCYSVCVLSQYKFIKKGGVKQSDYLVDKEYPITNNLYALNII